MEKKIINGKKFLVQGDLLEQEIEYFEINILEQNSIPGLMALEFVHTNEDTAFWYEWKQGDSLAEWLQEVHSKSEVLNMLESLAERCAEAEAWLLDERRLDFSAENICVTAENGKCELAYLPITRMQNEGLHNLVKTCLGRIQYRRGEDFLYLFDLQNAYSRGVIQEREDLLRWIKNEKSKSSNEERKSQEEEAKRQIIQEKKADIGAAAPSSADSKLLVQNKKKEKKRLKAEAKSGKEVLPLPEGMLLAEHQAPFIAEGKKQEKALPEKKGFFSFGGKGKEKRTAGQSVEQNAAASGCVEFQRVVVKEEIAETVFVGNADVPEAQMTTAQIVNRRNGVVYRLDQDFVLIGTDMEAADICIRENRAVSRKHARIVKRGAQYYLEDVGSKNGTFLNSVRVNPGQTAVLENGAVIAFANEEFIFSVQG